MKVLTRDELSSTILEFARRSRSVLFTGAGVGKRVKLPLWPEYIDTLAGVCERFGAKMEAQLMRQWRGQGRLIQAAGIYEMTDSIPIGERWKHLAEPFRVPPDETDLQALAEVFKLPFEAVVTTNYDSSQHAAYNLATKHFPTLIEREGTSMLAGAEITSFYIARIHGSADAPRSMVLYPSTYADLHDDETYQDFLLSLFRSRPCLFVGFSFLDPAIDMVLDTYKRKAGQLYQVPHAALLPADPAAHALAQRLSNLNIVTHYYDAAKGHQALWKAFRQAAAQFSKGIANEKKSTSSESPVSDTFRRFLSFTFAQVRISAEAQPLLQHAREGIILGIITDSGAHGVSEGDIVAAVQTTLGLDTGEATRATADGTAQLYRERQIRIKDDRYFSKGRRVNSLAVSLNTLAKGVLDRLKVQLDLEPLEPDSNLVVDALEHAFLVRAWDLAAHYAGGGGSYGDDVFGVLRDHVLRNPSTSRERGEAIATACVDLLRCPSNEEMDHLAEISRAAFSLQLVLASPRQSLFQSHALPQRVYFDASVLLPAIVPGHPFHSLYRESVDRLVKAAGQAGVDCRLCVGQPFLNEVIAHRERSLDIADALRLDNREEIRKRALQFGAENLNVFIGGFTAVAAVRGQQKDSTMSFRQYLAKHAPYTTESALQERLERWGFEVVPMDFRRQHNPRFVTVFNGLLTGYEKIKDDLVRGKERLLVEHEAAQLVQIAIDATSGLRAVFVSNDRKLRRAASLDQRTKDLVSSLLPPEAFVGLVDIVVGSRPDPRGLARLVWASPRRESDQILRDYLVKRALLEQDVAQAKASAEVISDIISEAKTEMTTRGVDLSDTGTAESTSEAVKLIDRFEDRFFEMMREAIEREERSERRMRDRDE
ncbi:MAG: SIR2 family protein [Planctomycetes bacterium]|nr:SIR2 family protein [Planctomycetota bacterium]